MKRLVAITALVFLIFGITQAQTEKISVQINASSDDAEERGSNATSSVGLMDLESSDIELVNDGNDGDQFVGLRFKNIQIPTGSIVKNAYIQFTVDETDDVTGKVVFNVEDTDNGTTFTSADSNISSRKLMTQSVTWENIPKWDVVGEAGEDQQTPDLSVLIQAIIDRSGWKAGNAINIIATGTGNRTAESYDGSSSSAPTLIVEFSKPVTKSFSILTNSDDAELDVVGASMDLTSTDLELTVDGTKNQLIGLRFDEIGIPNGSIITNAYVQFTVDEVNTGGQVDLLMAFQDTDDASEIKSTANELAGRSYLDSLYWNNIPDWSKVGDNGANQQTPDLSSLLQKVVNRKGWMEGNAVLLALLDPAVLTLPGYKGNTSKRVAQSYDKSASAAPKLVVTYIPPAVFQEGVFPVAKNSSWKYDDSGSELNSGWTDLSYNDSNWSFGNGVLGYSNGNETSTLSYGGSSSNKNITTYLRHTFNVKDSSVYDSLVFNVMRDDGVVVYVNGNEAFRMNMPSGTIGYDTLAVAAVGGSDESKYFEYKTKNLLRNGRNVIAVELHQNSPSSSDLSFDMEVGFELPPLKPASFPFAKNSDWHFFNEGVSLDDKSWQDSSFDDNNWDQGKGVLGYGNAVATTLSYGSDPNNKYPTAYFRRDINIDLATLPDSFELGVLRDDGIIFYVNGKEVRRDNLPSGIITYDSLAIETISGSAETTYYTSVLYKKDFKQGVNTIAVELHNRDLYSSDLAFDLYMDELPVVNPPALGCTDAEGHVGCFTSIAPTAQTSKLILPSSSHRFQQLFNQGDAYTIGGGNVPGNHDFTAYLALDGSSEIGHLAINHETTPGAVSIVDVSYDKSMRLWSVDSSQAVNFNNNDLVATARNCSGGITPWGTVITAEESLNNSDVNNDGYLDIGWLVEIDPLTAKVKEYENGKQEKLWACSRISHENALVLDDSITLYTGEDGGSSAVFKFVADNKTDLSAGKLYALKLDAPLSGNEPTSSTAKWIEIPNTTQADRNNSRALAVSLGATNFNGVEDIEVSPVDGMIYFAAKGKSRVYRFKDNGSSVSNFSTFVGGMSYILNTDKGVFTEPWGSGNDNLTFDDQGNLWVLQDGGNNYIWLVRPDHSQDKPMVELFASFPIGSEPTGLTFTPDYKFGFVSVQHPSGNNAAQQDATLKDIRFNKSSTFVFSRSAYLGPQPVIAGFKSDTNVVIAGNSVTFTDTSVNGLDERNWVFDGGRPAVSNKKEETVTYSGEGFYSVTLRSAGYSGEDTITKTNYIEVISPAPVTQFAADNVNIVKTETVNFLDFSTNNPTSWNWTFEGGDPSTSTDKNPSVKYNEIGSFDVTLVTQNRAGETTEAKLNYIKVDKNLSASKVRTSDDIRVYPNPTSGVVTVAMKLTGGEDVKISVYDFAGRNLGELVNAKITKTNQDLSFDLSTIVNTTSSVIVKISVDGVVTQKILNVVK